MAVRLGGLPFLAVAVELKSLLHTLAAGPQTTGSIALQMRWSRAQVEAALSQLQRGGYVEPALPGQGGCSSGCGWCSFKRLCPSSEGKPSPLEAWRLTARGESSL